MLVKMSYVLIYLILEVEQRGLMNSFKGRDLQSRCRDIQGV